MEGTEGLTGYQDFISLCQKHLCLFNSCEITALYTRKWTEFTPKLGPDGMLESSRPGLTEESRGKKIDKNTFSVFCGLAGSAIF